MNIKTNNSPINHTQINYEAAYTNIISQLVCTQKGRDIRNQNNDALTKDSLTKRERQFLLLLDSIDSISQKMCVSMAPKIRLKHMIELGLIASRVDNAKLLTELGKLNAQRTTTTNSKPHSKNKTSLTEKLNDSHSKKGLISKKSQTTKTAIEKANEQLAKDVEKTNLQKNSLEKNSLEKSHLEKNDNGINGSSTTSNLKDNASRLSGIKSIKKRIGSITNGSDKKVQSSINNLANQKAKGNHNATTKNTKKTPPPSIQVVAGVFID